MENKKSSNRKWKLLSFFIISITFIVLYYYLTSKKDDFVSDSQFPYIYDNNYLNSLSSFEKFENYNEVLVVTGIRGIGKTRGLRKFAEKVNNENRLVIDFDFQLLQEDSTNQDIINLIEVSLINAFKKFDGYLYRTNYIKYTMDELEALNMIINVKNRRFDFKGIKDKKLNRCLKLILRLISRISKKPKISINLLFNGIEALSKSFRPFIIIHSPEKLEIINSTFSNEVYEAFLNSFKLSDHDSAQYGVIVEVSDELWLYEQLNKYELKTTNFRIIKVNEFDFNDAKEQLNDMFKLSQKLKIMERFGGNGQYFAAIHEFMRNGLSFQDSFDNVYKMAYNYYNNSVIDLENAELTNERFVLLAKILSNSKEINPLKEPAKTLIKKGILTIIDKNNLDFGNKVYEYCTNEIRKNQAK